MSDDNLMGIVVVGGGMVLTLAIVIIGTLNSAARTRMQERTKREIAAYVAEGSISPQDAVAMLSAGKSTRAFEKEIASGVAIGMISPEKAENLVRAVRRGAAEEKARAHA